MESKQQPTKPVGMSWKEVNREFKEKRKKWREERLLKKARLADEQEIQAEKRAAAEKADLEVRRPSTVSIAVPGSILDNAQTIDLRYKLASQVARAACVFKVDEVVVFDDEGEVREDERKMLRRDEVLGEARPGCLQLARLLQYCECPQYLRKNFFPQHRDLERAGILDPLNAPHHLRIDDKSLFREGVVTNKPVKVGKGSLIPENPEKLKGIIVPPSLPRAETGVYWGYTMRLASNLSEVFAKCPYAERYNLSIGTSDKGSSIDDVAPKSLKYKHALIVFGGLSGIEAAVENDPILDVDDVSLVYNSYLNTCPEQGSRSIRREEAIFITLTELRHKLSPECPPLNNPQFNYNQYISVEKSENGLSKKEESSGTGEFQSSE